VHWLLHNVSSSIVKHAKENKLGIAMENIKGIRKLYRKVNGQGKNYRSRMNSWSFGELRRQIEYKAKWEGIPVVYVSARGTSAKCSECGDKMFPEENRMLKCSKCGLRIDRDVNAARNIMSEGVPRFGTDGPPGEAIGTMQERVGVTPILTVDGGKMAQEASA
jgi:putative transposase